ncbi:MAG TPA: nitroreductase family protein [Actinomycetota bacterium]|nr:nitroreductase family protein [Actinomycetota bacterium]
MERLLAAAVRAPTHHLTQPWRFVVLTGSALGEFGDAWVRGAEREGKDPEGIRDKALRAPVIIAVIETPKTHHARVQEIEEHYATGAAIQNILLAAHAAGMGAMLRTGPAAHIPEVLEHLGVDPDELVAGYIYLGYPPEDQTDRPLTRRTDPAELTTWRGFP